jgi:hypothetical protein
VTRVIKTAIVFIAVAVVFCLAAVYDRVILHFLGWDGQTSDNYAAWSGSVPALISAVGLSTLITGMWSHVNCHEPGCFRIGKHKVSGTPWCTVHHEHARPERSEHEILASIEASMTELLSLLRAQAGEPH